MTKKPTKGKKQARRRVKRVTLNMIQRKVLWHAVNQLGDDEKGPQGQPIVNAKAISARTRVSKIIDVDEIDDFFYEYDQRVQEALEEAQEAANEAKEEGKRPPRFKVPDEWKEGDENHPPQEYEFRYMLTKWITKRMEEASYVQLNIDDVQGTFDVWGLQYSDEDLFGEDDDEFEDIDDDDLGFIDLNEEEGEEAEEEPTNSGEKAEAEEEIAAV